MKSRVLNFLVLIFSFIALSFVYIYSTSNLTVIDYSLPDSAIKQKVFDEFTQGRKIKGEFTPEINHLGQVLVRFYTYNRINADELTFRIKEKDAGVWYYEHTYKTDQFLPDNLFTFGFPIIPNSEGKTYDFEIESVNGTPEESVTLSRIKPLAALSFQYPKTMLIKDPELAFELIAKKVSYTNFNRDFVFSLVEYLIFISISLMLIYLFLNQLFRLKNLKKEFGPAVIISGLLLSSLSAVLYYLKKPILSETLTIYGYFILIAGVFFLLRESRKP